MSAISRWLDRFCYRHPNFGIAGLMRYIVIGNVFVYLLDRVSRGTFTHIIAFYPSMILKGQVWRLLSFVFVPQSTTLIWFVLSVMMYYYLGTALERHWGKARFSMFYLVGVVMNIIIGFALYFYLGQPQTAITANMTYVNMSIFFSFATLYPDMQMLLYGIIPVKVKWFAWIDAILFAVDIVDRLASNAPVLALLPIVGIFNYLIFFWDDLKELLSNGKYHAARKMDPKTINFKKAQKEVQNRKGYLHKCAVCGITDADHPDMEFRYCSKCNGYHCYCMDHINSHVHI